MEQGKKKSNSRIYEDEVIVSNNCCTPFARVSTSNSTEKITSLPKSSRQSCERGILLTRKPISYSKLQTSKQLIIRNIQPLKLNQKAKRQQNLPSETNVLIGEQNQKKSFFVKKCIDYKNKKIQEHRNENIQQMNLNLDLSKRQELCSTMRNTARTINSSSFGALLFNQPISCNNISIQNSYIQECREDEKRIRLSEHFLYCKLSPKKTLQRVFQQTKGRRIETLESQLSNEESSNQYSEAQSYDFPYVQN